jgi:hypothetical protein
MVHFVERQVVGIVVGRRRRAADVGAPFGPEVHACRVDQQRTAFQLRRRTHVEDAAAAREHGNVDAEHCRDTAAPRARGVHHHVAGIRLAVRVHDMRDAPAIAYEPCHVARHITRTQCLRFFAQRLHETVAVEPALAAFAERACHEVFRVEPRKAFVQLSAIKQADVGAQALLQRVILAQRIEPRGRGEKQIAALMQIDGRLHAVHFEPLADGAQKLDAEQRHLNGERRRELLPDRRGRQRRRRARIRRVALDDGHANRWIGSPQEIRNRTADYPTADNDDFRTHLSLRKRTLRRPRAEALTTPLSTPLSEPRNTAAFSRY